MRSGRRGVPTFGVGMLVVLLLVVFQLAVAIAVVIGTAVLKVKRNDTVSLVVDFWVVCVAALLVLVWASGARREPLRPLMVPNPVAPVSLVLALVATLGAYVVLSQVDNWVNWLFPPGPFMSELWSLLERGSLPLILAVVVLAGPVSEELIFRGVLLRGFLENYRAWVAILLSSLLFAFIHLNPWQGVSGFFIGCLFAWFVARTGSLLPAITGHMMSNGLSVVVWRFRAILGITMEGFPPWWLTALGVLVTAGGLVAFHRATRVERNASAEVVASARRTLELP